MKYLLTALITVTTVVLSSTAAQAAPMVAGGSASSESAALAAVPVGATDAAAAASLPTCAEFSVFGNPGGDVAWQIPSVGHFDGNTNCVLGLNNQGAGVLVLQDALIRCYGQPIPADAKFGKKTRDAVRNVQAFHKLKIDGVYGPLTKSAMAFPKYRDGRYAYCW